METQFKQLMEDFKLKFARERELFDRQLDEEMSVSEAERVEAEANLHKLEEELPAHKTLAEAKQAQHEKGQ